MKSTIKTPTWFLPVIAAVGLLGVTTASGAVLTEYTFATNGASTNPTSNVSGSTAAYTGLSGSTVGLGGSLQSAFVRFDTAGTSFDSGKYLEFTLTADPGYVINLTSLTVDLGGSNVAGQPTRIASTQIRSNAEVSDYSTSLTLTPGPTTVAQVSLAGGTTVPASYVLYTADLTGAEFQNQTSVTFRIYGYGSASTTQAFWRADNVQLNGTVVAVPEPSTSAIVVVSGLVWMTLIRRRLGRIVSA